MPPENSKNDYSFITDQPVPESEEPRRSKKIFVVIGIAIVLLAALLLVGLLVTKKSTNIKPAPQPEGQAESAQFLQYLGHGDSEAAYNMYPPGYRKDSEKAAFQTYAKSFSENIDVSRCSLRSDVSQIADNVSVFVYRCHYFNKPDSKYVDYGLVFTKINGKKQLTQMFAAGFST